jgi:hypothetical protein
MNTTEHRANELLKLAARWDEVIERNDEASIRLSDDEIQGVLIGIGAEFADPGLKLVDIEHFLLMLRDSVGARNRWAIYGELPDFTEGGLQSAYDEDVITDRLDADVEFALFPLLSGSAFPCHECSRSGAPVFQWHARPSSTHRCASHVLIRA